MAEGVKRVGDHYEGCFGLKDPMPFVITADPPIDWRLAKNGRRGGSTMWWRFSCNDTKCPALLLVRWDVLANFLGELAIQEELE